MFTLAACKQSTIPEINFIDCCLSSSDQHFSYIYDKSISEGIYLIIDIFGKPLFLWQLHFIFFFFFFYLLY
jgi:hypothetical protein